MKSSREEATINYFLYIAVYILAVITSADHRAHAEEFILAHRDGDEYFKLILEAATAAADGTHTVKTHSFEPDIPQSRILRILRDSGHSPINVHFSGHSAEREQSLLQIDIPLTRGLYGYRAFIIRAADQEKFTGIKTLTELTRKISVGSGTSWPDTKILVDAGFKVKKGNKANLWVLLGRQQFIAFPRSIYEIHSDLQTAPSYLAGTPLSIEDSLMLHYPFDLFFYLAPTDTRRRDIILQGLERLYETGKFMEIFNSHPIVQKALKEAAQHKRRIIDLKNTLGTSRLQAIPAKYWHSFQQTTNAQKAPADS